MKSAALLHLAARSSERGVNNRTMRPGAVMVMRLSPGFVNCAPFLSASTIMLRNLSSVNF